MFKLTCLWFLSNLNTNKCFSKRNIPPYGPCWRSYFGYPWGIAPKVEEDLSEMWPNRRAKFHTHR